MPDRMKRRGRRHLLGLTALIVAGWVQTSGAVVRSSRAEPPVVTAGRAPRRHRDVAWVQHGALDRAGLASWTAIYDRDTGVPLRLWGPAQSAPGAMASPAAAEVWARGFLAAHLDLLAPGAAVGDFVVVANQLSPRGDVRSVGFAQRAGGLAVLGGTISFAFKRDRLIMVGSTALPDVAIAPPSGRGPRIPDARVTAAAQAWLAAAGHRAIARGGVAADLVIVPIVHPRGHAGGAGAADITYSVAAAVTMESVAEEPGRWTVYVDAGTGAAVARETALSFASGTVLFDVSDRAPRAAAGRHPQPAAHATHLVGGSQVTSDASGAVAWPGDGAATVVPGLTGPLVAVTNRAGARATGTLVVPAGGSAVWSWAADPAADAQLDAFVYANQVKRFAAARLDPSLAYLQQQLSVNVNESPGMCNAYSTGDDLHFYPQTPDTCENTARMADVVYHEFGHSLHRHAIIPGVGQFDGAMSEGVADTLAASIVGDSGVGRGFYFDNSPLRELDPVAKKIWPRDVDGEVHDDGEIYGETMWDLRTSLEASMGAAAGFDQFLGIYYGTVQRAVDIPSCFAEALVADDDDGDLANGTPHDCDIMHAFAAHGLFDPRVTGGADPPVRDSFTISVTGAAPDAATCHAPSIVSAVVAWRLHDGAVGELPLVASRASGASRATFRGAIPTQADGSIVEYNVTVTLSNGATQTFPGTPADPYYQFHAGNVTEIWCDDFETGAAAWTHSASPAAQDRWEAGVPAGEGGGPPTAFSGRGILGTALSHGGRYAPWTVSSAVSPPIALGGNTNVHLQYYRWLGVEDGYYDQATITANGAPVWQNYASPTAPLFAEVNLHDREWRFQDIDLSRQAATGQLTIAFGLASDPGVEAAGWNLDRVCIVAAGPSCGNGIIEAGEACDDGNLADGDGCSATCQDEPAPPAGGCCSAGTGPAAPLGLGALVLGLATRRRRRRR
jgi:MYXO-CTERM domain-containing protein